MGLWSTRLLPIPDPTPQWVSLEMPPEARPRAGATSLEVPGKALESLTSRAFGDISHFLRTDHLAQLASILDDPEASRNDRAVAVDLLKNAAVSSGEVLPMCQDTGTAMVVAKRGHLVTTDGLDAQYIERGIEAAYATKNLRYSQLAPLEGFRETNTGTNLPAEIDISFGPGDTYDFLFLAKGGGSANKTFLFQETKELLREDVFRAFVESALRSIGTSACPPYHLAIVIGGTSADFTLKTAKLAAARALDGLPTTGSELGHGFRDLALEETVLALTQNLGIGAQFGGKYFCHDVRVIRLPRHTGSLPVGIAVSCSADRQAYGRISADGVFIESLDTDPARFLPDSILAGPTDTEADDVAIDLNVPMSDILSQLRGLPTGQRVRLTGRLIVARDLAHAAIRERLERGEAMPDYLLNHPVYYAGPAKTPEGYPSGSFGPTTAGRMDGYVESFQAHGGSLVMLAKGNRSAQVAQSCATWGGFYLATVGGPAALIAQEHITAQSVIDCEELGMEAVFAIDVTDFPAFVIIDDQGNDFFARTGGTPIRLGPTRKDS